MTLRSGPLHALARAAIGADLYARARELGEVGAGIGSSARCG